MEREGEGRRGEERQRRGLKLERGRNGRVLEGMESRQEEREGGRRGRDGRGRAISIRVKEIRRLKTGEDEINAKAQRKAEYTIYG